MPSQSDEAALFGLLQQALDAPLGIAVSFLTPADASHVRQLLYRIRKEHDEYSPLSFSVKGTEVWIFRRASPVEETLDSPP